jgi:tetratricopeptide (TPR) repeat protein
MHFLPGRCSSPGSSTGDASLKLCLPFLLLLLLAGYGFGQQEPSPRLESILAAAQQAQSSNDYAAAAADYKEAVQLRNDIPELWANLGLMQHETGDYAGAIQSFGEAHRLRPSLYVPNLFLGVDFVHIGRAKEAVPVLLMAEKMNDRDPLPSLTLGRAYTSLGEYQAAAQQLWRTVRIDPKQSSAWFALGIVYLREVEMDSRNMTGQEPDSAYAKALFAEALVKQSRYKEAADLYRSVLNSSDQPACMRSEMGWLDLRQGDSDGAARAFRAEREAHPECVLAMLGEARLLIDSGDQKAAVQLLQQAWATDEGFFCANVSDVLAGMKPKEIEGLVSFASQQSTASAIGNGMDDALKQAAQGAQFVEVSVPAASAARPSLASAKLAFQDGHYQQCAEDLRGGVSSGNANQIRMLAACAYFSGEDELAAEAGDALRTLPAHSSAGLYWLIKAHERLAMNALAHFQQLEPNSVRSHILLGDIYRQRERYDDAQKEYSAALTISPGDPAALLGLASAYFDAAKIDEAIATARKVLANEPGDPETNVLMGEALISQHRYSDAEPYLLKGLNAKPQMQPHVHAMLGEVYAVQGKTEQAITEIKMGLDSDQDGGLHYQLSRLYSKAGDTADAATAIAQMKALQQQRRKAAVTAVADSHSSSLDDEP